MSSDSDSDDYYGPALPPGFKQGGSGSQTSSDKITAPPKKVDDAPIGPILPPALRAKLEAGASSSTSALEDEAGSTNDIEPAHNQSADTDSDSDSDVIGPLPPDHPKALLRVVAPSIPSSSSEKPKREEWMLVPPKNRIIPGLGLAPRKFLTRAPEDSHRSDEEEDEEEIFAREADAEIEKKLISDYDQKMEDMKKDFETKKRRGESLLEIHQKDLKKKKDKESDKAERKPFDRDTDLQVSGISSADKQKYIEKSKELNTKFSRGSRKYL